MTGFYQAPLTPYSGAAGGMGAPNYAPTRSPFWALANQFLPRNLHDVIRWVRFITSQSPVTTEVIRKFATYPITDFITDTNNLKLKERYEELYRSFRLKSFLHDVGFEYHTVGNVFISIYFPIHRKLICPHCKAEYNAKTAEFATFKNYGFEGDCPSCSTGAKFTIVDTKSTNISDLNLIKWDALNIAVNHNPITNEYEYFYKIPNEVKRRIKLGDKLFVNSVPWGIIEAVRQNQDFKFDRNNLFHMKNLSAGAPVEGVAVPPLISQFPLVFYQASLRRANESIANDYMYPMRVIFPQVQTAQGDPIVNISLKNFVGRMTDELVRHKQDPGQVVIAPTPIGYQAISGEGKALLISQEIAQAEETLLLSMGVSRELLSGTTNWTSSTVGLRMLSNTLSCYTDQVEELLEWIMHRAASYLGLEQVKVTLVPFRLTDDENMRQMLGSLIASGQASVSTLYESFGKDYDKELDRMKEDAVKKATIDVKTKIEVERAQFLASKDAGDSMNESDDYRTGLSRAQGMAEQLMSSDESTKRQVLAQLRVQDYSQFLMVSKLLEEYNQANRAEVNAQQAASAQQGQEPPAQAGQDAEQAPASATTSGN